MNHLLCLLTPTSCATTLIAKSTLGDIFAALTGWVLGSVQWFLSAAGLVVTSASEPATVIASATPEFDVLMVMAPVLMLIGLLVSTLQALRHGDAASLWRVYLGVAPSCVLGVVLARPLGALVLTAVNQLSSPAAATMAQRAASVGLAFSSLTSSTPGFGFFLLAIGVVVGSWLLWCELIVRTVVLTLLLVIVPVIVPLSTFPAMRRIGWRLGETFIAVAFSKFLIVITLSLGFDELRGSSATQIISGAVTMALVTFSPFLLFRLIPFLEQSALHHLDGLRQRLTHTAMNASSSPAGMAVRAMAPVAPPPQPPLRLDDLGLAMWEASPKFEFPEYTGEKLPPPIGEPLLRGGTWRTARTTWVRSSAGISMSELVGLGRSDADVRWLGIARHQAALVIGGSVLVGDWLVRTGTSVVELLIGVVMVSAAVRCVRGLTSGEFSKVVLLFCVRSRWQRLGASREGDVVELRASGTAVFRGYELDHRGRLDLSGTDVVNAQRLADLMNGLAVGADSSHVSLHVRRSGPNTRTFMALAKDATVCEGWSPSECLVDEVIGMDVGPSSLVLERWGYLRTNDELRRVIRVDDFQGATSERALLDRLQEVALDIDLAVHVEVIGSLRAQRIAARAVHRVGSDAQVSRAAGFRRSAHAALSSQRLGQREELVANGQALLRLGVFVTLRSSNLSELRDSSRELQRKVVESGLRVDTGVGRQWSWFCFQLPGGPGW